MHEFHYRKGALFCEGVDIQKLTAKYGTPLYIYSQRTIEEHYVRLNKALAGLERQVCYAVKANSNLAILSALAKKGSGFDVVSMGELYRVMKSGGDPRRTVFAGVGKTEEEICFAIERGIYCFNVESEAELHRISRVASAMKKKAPVSLRVNPNVSASTHAKITTGTYENKFGIPIEQIEDLYEQASLLPGIVLRGIQMHIGSQITTVAPFAKAIHKMIPLVSKLRDRFKLEFFSVGGGIGIIYRPALESGHNQWWTFDGKSHPVHGAGRNALPLTIDLYARTLLPLLKPLGMKILLEPGRFIVGNAGVLVTRVEYLKHTGRKNFVIVDAAMNDLIRPAFYDSFHQIVPVVESADGQDKKVKCDIVGPVCESGDFFAKDRSISAVRSGELLAIMSAGAYGFTMASNYNARPRPPEILVHGKTIRVVRRRETLEDLVRGESR